MALGIDESEVKERVEMKSVSKETTFEMDTDDPQILYLTMNTLVEEVHRNINGEELRFKTVTVKMRYEGFETKTKAKTLLHFTDSVSILRNNAQSLLRSLCGSTRIRLIGLRVSSFEKSDATQMTLKV